MYREKERKNVATVVLKQLLEQPGLLSRGGAPALGEPVYIGSRFPFSLGER